MNQYEKIRQYSGWHCSIVTGIPPSVLHSFACDCADRFLEKEREAGRTPDRRSVDVVKAKRRWMRGEISLSALEQAKEEADEADFELDEGYTWACHMAAQLNAEYGALSAALLLPIRFEKHEEERWLRNHLADLLERWEESQT